MNEKILYPVFGSQSIGAVLDHLKNLEMSFDARMRLAQGLMQRFSTVNFKVTFNKVTGEIEKTELLEL